MTASINDIIEVSSLSPSYLPPVYSILETFTDRITGITWNKIQANLKTTKLIVKSKQQNNWEIKAEITGKKFIWITAKMLLLIEIQGAIRIDY